MHALAATPRNAAANPTRHLAASLAICLVLTGLSADGAIVPRLKRGEKLNVAAIGTSLTAAGFSSQNWFTQVGDWLSSQYPGQVKLSNRAVSGTCSCNLSQFDRPHGGFYQLEQVLAHDNPDAIFIEFATNDASRLANMSVADSRRNLKSMIDQINAWASKNKKTVEIIVLTMNNVGPACDGSYKDTSPYYQGWLEEAAANHVLAIDLQRDWLALYNREPDHATWKSYVPDELHPNPLGTAKVIVPAVQKALNEQASPPKAGTANNPSNAAGRTPAGSAQGSAAPPNPKLVKLPFAFPTGMENTPVVYKGRPLLVQNYRSLKAEEQESKSYLFIQDMVTGQEVARLGIGFSFVSAFVNGDEMNVFGTVNTNKEWTKDVYRFWSTDLKTWKKELAIARDGDEHLFNTSVCRDDQGYVMAYESNKPVQWSFRFARSKDLSRWEKVPGVEFADVEGQTACGNPTIRYCAPYYYMVYGIWRWKGPGTRYEYRLPETKYVTAVARSKDLTVWEVSPTRAPMLDPVPGEGINNTDADLFECEGNTYLYYATGDQATWGTIRVAMYAGPMKEMLEAYFPANVPMTTFDAQKRKYCYPK